MSGRPEIERVLDREGVLAVARHPALARTSSRMLAEGVLRALAPGVYCRWQDAARPDTRVRAAAASIPTGVLTGPAAARLTFWPEIPVPYVTISSPTKRASRPGIVVTREDLPPALLTQAAGCRVTAPALTALDLVAAVGGEGIDRVLRLRLAGLDDLAEAIRLTPGRHGNRLRRAVLLDSRDQPWSEAEREGQRLLRAAGIGGWRGNLPVRCGDSRYFVDIGFERIKLAVEIDGYDVHRAEDVAQFRADRRKWTVLFNHGWGLLHFAGYHVFREADWYVSSVETAVRRAARRSVA